VRRKEAVEIHLLRGRHRMVMRILEKTENNSENVKTNGCSMWEIYPRPSPLKKKSNPGDALRM
jgi:hypothetical protein